MKNIPFDKIDPAALLDATVDLEKRISTRFPGSGLSAQAGRLVQIVDRSGPLSRKLARPNRFLQFLMFLFIAAPAAGIVLWARNLHISMQLDWLTEAAKKLFTFEGIQGLQALTEELIYLAIVVFAIFKADRMWRASKVCAVIRPLEAFVRVVNLRQLKKDPERVGRRKDDKTEASGDLDMSAFDLRCYLGHALDIVSVGGTVAALFGQEVPERSVSDEVSHLDDVIRGIEAKIGNKMLLLQLQFGNAALHKDEAEKLLADLEKEMAYEPPPPVLALHVPIPESR